MSLTTSTNETQIERSTVSSPTIKARWEEKLTRDKTRRSQAHEDQKEREVNNEHLKIKKNSFCTKVNNKKRACRDTIVQDLEQEPMNENNEKNSKSEENTEWKRHKEELENEEKSAKSESSEKTIKTVRVTNDKREKIMKTREHEDYKFENDFANVEDTSSVDQSLMTLFEWAKQSVLTRFFLEHWVFSKTRHESWWETLVVVVWSNLIWRYWFESLNYDKAKTSVWEFKEHQASPTWKHTSTALWKARQGLVEDWSKRTWDSRRSKTNDIFRQERWWWVDDH